ncbi:MAG: DUF3971 domain-containing protein [Rhodopila sp.]|nr:DUF3971 domain-containing protein [Rhodopila sp.]
MRLLWGQSARGLVQLLNLAVFAVLAAVVAAGVGVTLLGWRLSKGPLDLPWLAHRIEATVNADDNATHLGIGSAALAWEGFRDGFDRPLDIRLQDVVVSDAAGTRLVSVPAANVSLSLLGLLSGRIQPLGIVIDRPRIRVLRSADGAISLDLGSRSDATDSQDDGAATATVQRPEARSDIDFLGGLLAAFARPAGYDLRRGHSRFDQLRHVHIADASILVVDHQLQATWGVPRAEVELTRDAASAVAGRANLTVTLGEETARVSIAADLPANGTSTHIHATTTPVVPAALARATASLAPLCAFNGPVGADVVADLGPTLALEHAWIKMQFGAGDLHMGAAIVPVADGVVVASGDAQEITLESAQLAFRGHDGGAISVLSAEGTLQRQSDRLHTDFRLLLDQVSFADLPKIWPPSVGGDTRDWITGNITAGTARNGHVEAQIDVQPDFSDATLSSVRGTLDADGLTVHWLRPIPPIDQGVAQLRILDPDTLEIAVQSGRQRPAGGKTTRAAGAGGLMLRGGMVRITGITQPEQKAAIEADIAGPLADAIAVLRSPRLHLLDTGSVDLKDASGQTSAKLSITLPLKRQVTMDTVAIAAQVHLDAAHLGGIVAGRDLDQGVLDMKFNNDGMTIAGKATIATIPTRLDVAMDFRAGPPSQVLQTVNVVGRPTVAQLTFAGLNPDGVFTGGTAGVQATLVERRDGQGQLKVSADLADAALRLDLAGWIKPAGTAAQASAAARLNHDRLVEINQIRLTGGGVQLQANAAFAGGKVTVLQINQLTLGGTSAKGSVRFPATAGGAIVARVSGTIVDLSSRLSNPAPADQKAASGRVSFDTAASDHPPGQPWAIDVRFERAIMANGQTFDGLVLHAEDNGTRLTRVRFDVHARPKEPITLEIAPSPGGRRLTAKASDVGRLLGALAVTQTIQGGRLSVTSTFDDQRAGQPLSGSAAIEDFRIRNAPAFAKLLQGMTLYGLVKTLSGPGLHFTRLIAPFRLTASVLEFRDARAFSPSLGLTAKGQIDLANARADVDGTVVPAYFFNSLLGRLPLIGKLLSPEKGGGLFAANYSVRGSLSDPSVSVNPLSAVTPGFLRGLFGNAVLE